MAIATKNTFNMNLADGTAVPTPKPLTAITKETNFVAKAGTGKVLPTPRRNRVRKGSDSENYGINIMLFGPVGSGKTRALVGLLKKGLKVLCLISDIGNNGIITVKLALKQEGLSHLLDNLTFIALNGHKEVSEFLDEPAAFWPEIYDEGIDVLFWDGFSSYQGTDLMEYVGGMIEDGNVGSREVSELRSEGVRFELSDYKVVRDVTIRVAKEFCRLNNKKTGQIWHHIMTCHEAIKSSQNGKSGFSDTAQPFLTGSGGVYLMGAFDLVIKTQAVGDEKTREFEYVITGNKNLVAKNRGFSLPPVMEGDFEKLWTIIESDLDMKRGATNEALVAPVLIAEE